MKFKSIRKNLAICLSCVMICALSQEVKVMAWTSGSSAPFLKGTTGADWSEYDSDPDGLNSHMAQNFNDWILENLPTDTRLQSAHELITDVAYLRSHSGNKISAAVEQGSYWNDLMSHKYESFMKSYMRRNEILPGYKNYTDISDEITHLFRTQMFESVKDEDDEEINARFSHNNRGNYLHCMNCESGSGESLGQEKTYEFIMKWLEFAVAFAKDGPESEDIEDPRMKKLVMSSKDVVRYTKKKVESSELEQEKLKQNLVKFMKEHSSLIEDFESILKSKKTTLQSFLHDKDSIELLSCFILESEYSAKKSEPQFLRMNDFKWQLYAEIILDRVLSFNPKEKDYRDIEYLKNRALGMICHTIEDSFNLAHCDRVITYDEDGKASLSNIKSFLDYSGQIHHAKFDVIPDNDWKILKVGKDTDLNEVRTIGLKEAEEIVEEFFNVFDSNSDKTVIMNWISQKAIHFDERIATIQYVPYMLSDDVNVYFTENHGEIYKNYVTPNSGRMMCDAESFFPKDEIRPELEQVATVRSVLDYLKKNINLEREYVLSQKYDLAKQCRKKEKSCCDWLLALQDAMYPELVENLRKLQFDLELEGVEGSSAEVSDYIHSIKISEEELVELNADVSGSADTFNSITKCIGAGRQEYDCGRKLSLISRFDFSEDVNVRAALLQRQWSRTKIDYAVAASLRTFVSDPAAEGIWSKISQGFMSIKRSIGRLFSGVDESELGLFGEGFETLIRGLTRADLEQVINYLKSREDAAKRLLFESISPTISDSLLDRALYPLELFTITTSVNGKQMKVDIIKSNDEIFGWNRYAGEIVRSKSDFRVYDFDTVFDRQLRIYLLCKQRDDAYLEMLLYKVHSCDELPDVNTILNNRYELATKKLKDFLGDELLPEDVQKMYCDVESGWKKDV